MGVCPEPRAAAWFMLSAAAAALLGGIDTCIDYPVFLLLVVNYSAVGTV